MTAGPEHEAIRQWTILWGMRAMSSTNLKCNNRALQAYASPGLKTVASCPEVNNANARVSCTIPMSTSYFSALFETV
jgi:hypothetical protein